MTKKYTIHFCILCCFLLVSAISNAQQINYVKGKIIDKKDKQPIIGASVVIVDKDRRVIKGVSSDIDGNYSLPVADKTYRISVSYIGYKSTAPIAIDKAVINFQLESSDNQMDEVQIVSRAKTDNGSGMSIDKRDQTSAIGTINAKELEDMQAASIDQALQGRLAGLDIAASSGDPGAPMQIRIRGTSSINGAVDPLIVVDGMPYDITIPSDFNFATSDENNYGQLLNIAPSDIKDISVLKDAAATAIWGSRAANGVLVINTKRGAMGPPNISYNFKGSYSKQPSAIPMLNGNQYSSLILEEFYNANRQFSTSDFAKEFQYDKNDPYNYYNYSNNTDWLQSITRIGYLQDHNLSISGGGEKARYRASLNYFNQEGTTKGTSLGRLSARVNLDYILSTKIRFSADIAYTHIDNQNLYSTRVRDVAYNKMPNQAVYEYDEYGNLTSNYFSPAVTAQGLYAGTYNPLAMVMAASNSQLGERVIPKFGLQYQIIPDLLRLNANFQADINNTKVKTFLPQIATGRPFTEAVVNSAGDSDGDSFTMATNITLAYTPKLGKKHDLIAFARFDSNDSRRTGQGMFTTNTASSYLADPSIDSRTNGNGSAYSSYAQSRSVGLLLNAQYKFLDRYIFNAGIRGDGNSKFGPNNRYGLFPSASFRWRVSGEPFMAKANKYIDDLSFRASYGIVGNAPRNDYSYLNTYQNYGFSYLGTAGVYPTNIELSDLRWEKVAQSNVGLTIVLLNNRLNVDVDVYRKRTTDLFYPGIQIPTYNGYNGIDMNVGTMDNQGWEFAFNYTPVRSKKLRIDFSFNISHNENIIREIDPLYPRENGGKITNNNTFKVYLQENNPFGSFYGFKYKGVYKDANSTIALDESGNQIIGPNGQKIFMRFAYPSIDYVFQPGDAMYEDINHDGNIDYKDIIYLGNSNPNLTGGFGTGITLNGNIRFGANFSYRTGYQIINGTKITTTNMYGFNNQSTAVLRRWKSEGDITDIPRATYGTGYNFLGSDRYVEDGSYLRLRSITMKYDFNKSFLKRIGMKGLSANLMMENVLTFTKYTGQDPEVPVKLSAFSTVIDNSTTPPIKTVTLGLTANF
ncbi:SusC/RagA family TonB-linked outer membrane protein [Pedobacter frigidisoli]|uniref:SusC/RagA family TonB-linked outer membrane protein n=1 Tax=Pedobacter frigidisoli TaxID=2530455 RepID=A0A4R0NVT6_9SPHI|nr:SusC/RagA family TonB-linked outer membrane protein [Pedobacter frigidisoli]TCD05632.1 SusC/RagA family TonB-linked outer membrane protein [Pedobacter frigidisoli]